MRSFLSYHPSVRAEARFVIDQPHTTQCSPRTASPVQVSGRNGISKLFQPCITLYCILCEAQGYLFWSQFIRGCLRGSGAPFIRKGLSSWVWRSVYTPRPVPTPTCLMARVSLLPFLMTIRTAAR